MVGQTSPTKFSKTGLTNLTMGWINPGLSNAQFLFKGDPICGWQIYHGGWNPSSKNLMLQSSWFVFDWGPNQSLSCALWLPQNNSNSKIWEGHGLRTHNVWTLVGLERQRIGRTGRSFDSFHFANADYRSNISQFCLDNRRIKNALSRWFGNYQTRQRIGRTGKNVVEFVVIIINVVTSDSRGMKRVAIDIALNAIVEAPKHCWKCHRQMLVNVCLELVLLGLC